MISGIQETTQADYTGARTSNRVDNTLGKDAFLKMLIAQLRHQDPLNPMDGTAFVAQLAQFSSLEQLTNLNEAMGALPKYLNQFSNAQMANLIGNEAVVKGNSITVSGSATNIVYRLPAEIQNGTIKFIMQTVCRSIRLDSHRKEPGCRTFSGTRDHILPGIIPGKSPLRTPGEARWFLSRCSTGGFRECLSKTAIPT